MCVDLAGLLTEPGFLVVKIRPFLTEEVGCVSWMEMAWRDRVSGCVRGADREG